MNINDIKNIDSDMIKASDFLDFIKNGDMNFEAGKDFILYSGSIEGKTTAHILSRNNNLGHMNVANTSTGTLTNQIFSNEDGMGKKFRQAVINEFAEKGDFSTG